MAKEKETAVVIDTVYTNSENASSIKHEQAFQLKLENEREKADSIRLIKALRDGLSYAEENKNKKSFHHEFEVFGSDSSFNITVQLEFGNLFDMKKKHLLVRRVMPWCTVINVYRIEDRDFKLLFERDQSGLTYIDDTLRDVNGDRYKDLVIHWYPAAGCCLADVYNVYLYQPQYGDFTADYKFLNPEFEPNKKTIRGLTYGHPGEAELYTFKWNGLLIDTIEFIYNSPDQKGKFLRKNKREMRSNQNKEVVIDSLPDEYRKMDSLSINWFLNNLTVNEKQ